MMISERVVWAWLLAAAMCLAVMATACGGDVTVEVEPSPPCILERVVHHEDRNESYQCKPGRGPKGETVSRCDVTYHERTETWVCQ
jgi:hypothetical protein